MHGLISAPAQIFTELFGTAEIWNVFLIINLFLLHMKWGGGKKKALAQVQEGMIAVFVVSQ